MVVAVIEPERVQCLTSQSEAINDGEFVLYWMQASVRSTFNQALEFAIQRANELKLPLVVVFSLTKSYPEANLRHYVFLLEGLRDVENTLRARGISFYAVFGEDEPWRIIADTAKGQKAAMVVTDMGYLNHLRAWRKGLSEHLDKIPLIQIETEATCPVTTVSDKCEFAARTIRPKIHKIFDKFIHPLGQENLQSKDLPDHLKDFLKKRSISHTNFSNIEEICDGLPIDKSVKPYKLWKGGELRAQEVLKEFIEKRLAHYDDKRNNINADGSSQLSMYLHYGHVSPIECVLEARSAKVKPANKESFIEELTVRRELSFNHCYFEHGYDKLETAVPEWALKTMKAHAKDKRPHVYTYEQLEEAKTHDPYFNACVAELKVTGRMPNYLRMYWGKKFIEYCATFEEAFQYLARMNNKFMIDGRDCNSWCNFAWIFGAKDRPWSPERHVFGQLRYMNAEGLERKFDMKAYLEYVSKLTGRTDLKQAKAEVKRRKSESNVDEQMGGADIDAKRRRSIDQM
eukprot:Blabericola_migrator_1__4497@NODE_239_length_10968_cov_172_108797_g194_i1_p2_GENE_NODE_239_length_10968_cov_172_108797_g194_i1NODE_239_length_10968_cov_172_108797_g194_i1_p2_ORF_typecomplete_len515_score107_65DNA_photolyase/PF00875_18/2_7e19FAD_binding_7/PF03441_14/6_1e03FAD_binding_7/PF03441_14/1_2e12Usp/PF00582_26/0_41Usp/PF00582_26/1_4e04_NODE_239_length_10968_cov_172_108797_g194_i135215065